MPTADTTTSQPQHGTYVVCGRCKGTGEARYNHLNGDTHCYQCNGEGVCYRPSAAEKARQEADQAWYSAAIAAGRYGHGRGKHANYPHIVRRAAREATETTPWLRQADREALAPAELAAYEAGHAADNEARHQLARRLTWWVGEGLDAAMEEKAVADAARLAAAKAAARKDPALAKRLAASIAKRAAARVAA